MSELKIGRMLTGVDMNEYWYCRSVGLQNRGCKRKSIVSQVKVHKKYKEEKITKEKKEKKGKE